MKDSLPNRQILLSGLEDKNKPTDLVLKSFIG
jgi:hypothetical protein